MSSREQYGMARADTTSVQYIGWWWWRVGFEHLGAQQPTAYRTFQSYSLYDFSQLAFFNRGKHATYWIGWIIHVKTCPSNIEVLVKVLTTYLAEKGFSALFDMKTIRMGCLHDDTRWALEQEVQPNWLEIDRNIQQRPGHRLTGKLLATCWAFKEKSVKSLHILFCNSFKLVWADIAKRKVRMLLKQAEKHRSSSYGFRLPQLLLHLYRIAIYV